MFIVSATLIDFDLSELEIEAAVRSQCLKRKPKPLLSKDEIELLDVLGRKYRRDFKVGIMVEMGCASLTDLIVENVDRH